MNAVTTERPIKEERKVFATLAEEVAALKPEQQEKLSIFVQGYVAAMSISNGREKAAI